MSHHKPRQKKPGSGLKKTPGDMQGEGLTRRRLLRAGSHALFAAGAGLATGHWPGVGIQWLPDAQADSASLLRKHGKQGLVLLNDRPLNAETPAWLLDDEVTPVSRLFVRNNGVPPAVTRQADNWTLEVAGESCLRPRSFSLAQLKQEFEHHSYQLVLECGGNGRAEFNPPASGNQWTTGAVGCPQWTGVRLKDVLQACGIGDDAVYVGYYGADTHLSGDPDRAPISRGVPMRKALEDETLLAWAMNSRALAPLHGFPLRLVVGGWPASTSGKWLTRLVVRNQVHDGAKMGGASYRVPCTPVAPGAKVADEDLCIIESMPVKSLITHPKSGVSLARSQALQLRGHAWAGDRAVGEVWLSTDYGAHWQQAKLRAPVNRLAWQHWETELQFAEAGYYEIWARAVDEAGTSQPMVMPSWNPRGYLNNACHRIAVQVA